MRRSPRVRGGSSTRFLRWLPRSLACTPLSTSRLKAVPRLADPGDLTGRNVQGGKHTLLSIGSGAERAVGVAIAADLLGTDECIDAEIRDALQSGEVEVTLWGESRFAERATAVQYRFSAAARMFKDCALAAAMLTDVPLAPVETLFCSGYRPVDSHLIPVS